jgi:SLIT-ROBO Rho GTPase activating protein
LHAFVLNIFLLNVFFSTEMEMMKAVALFDYNGRTNKELSFKTNQIIYIYKKINHQWWFGYIAGRNQSGFIPDSYIKLKSKFVLSSTCCLLKNFYF